MYPQLKFFQSNSKTVTPVWLNTRVIVIAGKSEWKGTVFIADWAGILMKQKPSIHIAKFPTKTGRWLCRLKSLYLDFLWFGTMQSRIKGKEQNWLNCKTDLKAQKTGNLFSM